MFVPGIDERKIRKSITIEADTIILDLEDSVPLGFKEEARNTVKRALSDLNWGKREICIRINPLSTIDSYKDVSMIERLEVDCIVVPKAEATLEELHRATGMNLIAMIETPRGFMRLEDIVSSEGVTGVTWGPADLALHMGGFEGSLDDNDYLRVTIAIAAATYDVDPIDKVYFNIRDLDGFRRDALKAKMLGYIGKMVIHPSQVSIANDVFSPSEDEIAWARRVVKAYEEAMERGLGAISLEGKLIDSVHYKMAKRLLERWKWLT